MTKDLPYVVCAFYTDDDIYRGYAETLRESLVAHQLPHDITKLPADHFKGHWKAACRWKPRFIAAMLLRHCLKDVLYLDADAAVLSHPTLFDRFEGDLGVHLRPPGELFASTIYVKNSDAGQKAVMRWWEHVEQDEKNDDQTMLQRTVDELRGEVSVVNLPSTYAYKFAQSPAEAVIGQYQASRRVRALNGGKAP